MSKKSISIKLNDKVMDKIDELLIKQRLNRTDVIRCLIDIALHDIKKFDSLDLLFLEKNNIDKYLKLKKAFNDNDGVINIQNAN